MKAVILKMCSGFGFLQAEGGEVFFFPFSEWRPKKKRVPLPKQGDRVGFSISRQQRRERKPGQKRNAETVIPFEQEIEQEQLYNESESRSVEICSRIKRLFLASSHQDLWPVKGLDDNATNPWGLNVLAKSLGLKTTSGGDRMDVVNGLEKWLEEVTADDIDNHLLSLQKKAVLEDRWRMYVAAINRWDADFFKKESILHYKWRYKYDKKFLSHPTKEEMPDTGDHDIYDVYVKDVVKLWREKSPAELQEVFDQSLSEHIPDDDEPVGFAKMDAHSDAGIRY